jgi:uncharacterized membrane protein (UPF0182 family)
VYGASYTDVHAQLPALRLLVIMALIVGVLFLINMRVRGWTIPIAGIALLFLTSILAGGAYPAIVQRVRVTPAERTREAPFIQRNIDATREAFGVNEPKVKTSAFTGGTKLDRGAITRNRDTVENIRLWSPSILLRTYSQPERLKQYYEFVDVDVGRYRIGDRVRQVMLSPREISQASLPPASASWQNTHLTYTHGYGVVASRVDRVTEQGHPSFIVNQIPPVYAPGAPRVNNPRIYFGELEDTPYVIVRSELKELDFPVENNPQGFEQNVYEGSGGIPLSTFSRRLAFAWRFRDANLMLSSSVTKDSRIILRRNIAARVQAVAPYLKLDHDPYVVMNGDRLMWVQDAYTTTPMFPYSQRIDLREATDGFQRGVVNYMRNSVKVTVDAIDGTVSLYVADPTDPLIRTWQKIFPGHLRPLSEMPAELRSHLRYPEDLFLAQAYQYRVYHVTDPVTFFTGALAWDRPDDPANASQHLPPFYMMTTLPGERAPEYVLMLPFTPNGRTNMVSWLVARSDQQHYGELRAYVLPEGRNALGPEQVEAQIKQDPDFSREQTLLGQAGSSLLFGNLLTVPVENSLLYVQPFYLAASGTNIPELKFIAVVNGENVATGKTLSAALSALVGSQVGGEEPPSSAGKTVADFIAEALRHYAAAQEALRKSDFGRYGTEQAAMKAALDRAAALSGATPSPSPSPSPTR